MKLRYLLLALIAPLAGFATPTFANAQAVEVSRARPARVVSDRAAYTIVYDHLAGTLRLLDGASAARGRAYQSEPAEAPVLPVPPDRPVIVRIEHANPLLYEYKVEAWIVQQRQERSCRNVLGSFVEKSVRLSVANLSSAVQPRAKLDSLLRGPLSDQIALHEADGTTRGGTDAERALGDASVRIARFAARAEQLADLARGLADSLEAVAEAGDATDSGDLLDALREHVLAQLPGIRRPADLAIQYRRARDELVPTATAVVRFASSPAAPDGVDHGPEARALQSRLDSALVATRRAYRAIEDQLVRIDSARSHVTQQWLVAESGDVRRLAIRIEPTRGFPDAYRIKAGTVETYTVPRTTVGCQLAIGVALMDSPASYALRGDTIVSTAGPSQRSTGQILLHMDAPAVHLPLGALLGLGLGANRRPDLYAGGSVHLSDVVRVNVGAVWQKEQRLPRGYARGSIVTDPAARAAIAERARSYRPALFWGVSLAH